MPGGTKKNNCRGKRNPLSLVRDQAESSVCSEEGDWVAPEEVWMVVDCRGLLTPKPTRLLRTVADFVWRRRDVRPHVGGWTVGGKFPTFPMARDDLFARQTRR